MNCSSELSECGTSLMSPDTIAAIATAVGLALSELLPFIDRFNGNGVLHTVMLVVRHVLFPHF